MKLTKNQKAAIEHAGRNLQLIACAGSGKTEVVAQRVVHLLTPGRADSLQPRNIVAFTFTEKAAGELKERIIRRTHEKLGEVPGLAEMFVGTIHAFALELLKAEVADYLKYEVLNEVQLGLFTDRHSKQSGLTTTVDLKGQPLKRYRDTKHYLTALSIIRESEVNRPKLKDSSLLDGLALYRDLLGTKRYFDYSAILEAAVQALKGDESLRQRLAERIKYVIVDEYQDVNPIQEAIASELHAIGARICVVGDDDQTIYQWRGSAVGNILTFKKRYPGVDTVPLEENFRSSDAIVETARHFIAKNTERLEKSMKPTGAQASEVGDVVALSFSSHESEAEYIVEQCRALRGVAFQEGGAERGLAWSDMAILLRSVKSTAETITKALSEAGIPYVVSGMTNLFETPEAEAARQLFYFIADREGATAESLEQHWTHAKLGLAKKDLRAAIADALKVREAFALPDQKRWGLYSIQRVFMNFLETAGVREEVVPEGRGEVVFYNLGKFSQIISDFETIHFHSKPADKYGSFADFLLHRADSAYPEGWQDNQYANPDAVRIMTVHQAKGMQWPVVFLPSLLKNRFPAKGAGGRSVWHILPREGVKDQARFEGSVEDERRLFYVAMTRSQKFLHMTWGPVTGNQLFQRESDFWNDVLVSKHVKRKQPDYTTRRRLPPQPKASVANVVFSFSDLKYFFECPYQFKLRVLYGFNAPLHEALGYGKSLHDVLADVHARALRGDFATVKDVPALLETHLHVPYAYPKLREQLQAAADRVVRDYLADNAKLLPNLEHSEKQIEIGLGDGVSVVGRIDLVRRVDTGEVTIVDLKSSDRAQPEQVTETQLHIYALGYEELTGRRPDYVEIYELDDRRRKPRSVDEDFIEDVRSNVRAAANALRTGELPPKPVAKKCAGCDYRVICRTGQGCK